VDEEQLGVVDGRKARRRWRRREGGEEEGGVGTENKAVKRNIEAERLCARTVWGCKRRRRRRSSSSSSSSSSKTTVKPRKYMYMNQA
jgi:hypothetical protein